MGTLTTIALIVFTISFVVFVIFFGRIPALRNTPIGALNRLIAISLPSALARLDNSLTGGKVIPSLTRFGKHVAFGRHPTVLIFFFLLLSVGEFMYLPSAWPALTLFHKITGAILIVIPYILLYLSAFSDPGIVSQDNVSRHMSMYPYDFTLFHPGQVCRTCRILKPARSKHCAVCGRCVARLDHHCVFINNCVGQGNQHYFLLLLLSVAVLTTYGGLMGLRILGDRAIKRFPLWTRWKPADMDWDAWLTGWGYGIQTSVGTGSVTLLTLLTTPMVWGLLAYQLYLVWCGTTTNETMKWADWKVEMDEGCAFKRPLLPSSSRTRNPNVEALDSRWPVEPVQILVRTEDGTPPAPNNAIPGVGDWTRVYRLAEVENLYDLGFWDNMCDVFIPGYTFGNAGRGKELPSAVTTGTRRRKSGRRRD